MSTMCIKPERGVLPDRSGAITKTQIHLLTALPVLLLWIGTHEPLHEPLPFSKAVCACFPLQYVQVTYEDQHQRSH